MLSRMWFFWMIFDVFWLCSWHQNMLESGVLYIKGGILLWLRLQNLKSPPLSPFRGPMPLRLSRMWSRWAPHLQWHFFLSTKTQTKINTTIWILEDFINTGHSVWKRQTNWPFNKLSFIAAQCKDIAVCAYSLTAPTASKPFLFLEHILKTMIGKARQEFYYRLANRYNSDG